MTGKDYIIELVKQTKEINKVVLTVINKKEPEKKYVLILSAEEIAFLSKNQIEVGIFIGMDLAKKMKENLKN